MPHIVVEYSANVEDGLSISALVRDVHEAVIATGTFKPAAVRTRAERRDIFLIADCDPQNAFINIVAKIGRGRDAETRRELAQAIMDALERQTTHMFASRGLALSVYVEEIDEAGALRKNNLHARAEQQLAPGNAAQ
jgi:5-carboxymethyl-2-hydroxymuconate isomerase